MSESLQTKALGQTPILRLLWRFYIPALCSTAMTALYNIVDRIFVGNFCGSQGLAAITICMSPALLFLAISMLVGQGGATFVSICLGKKNVDLAEKAATQCLLFFILFCAAIFVAAIFFTREIIWAFGARGEILEQATLYYRVILLGLIFEKISFGLNNIIRAEGRPVYSMLTLFIGTICNIVLDWLFIAKFKWGIQGAAIATVAAQAIASLWVLRFYALKLGVLRLKLCNFKFTKNVVKKIAAFGSPSFVIQMLAALSTAVMLTQASKLGNAEGVAIIGVVMTANLLVFLPVLGMNMGAQPIYGYNWGAKLYLRVKSAFKYTLFFTSIFAAAGFFVFFFFSKNVFEIFVSNEPLLVCKGAYAMKIMVLSFFLLGINISTSSFFQSTGRPKFSIFLTVLRQLFVLVPLMIFLPAIFGGITGLWAAFPISDAVVAIYSIFITLREFGMLNNLNKKLENS